MPNPKPNPEEKCEICESYRGNPPPHVCINSKLLPTSPNHTSILDKYALTEEGDKNKPWVLTRKCEACKLGVCSPHKPTWQEQEREAWNKELEKRTFIEMKIPRFHQEGFNTDKVADYWLPRIELARKEGYQQGRIGVDPNGWAEAKGESYDKGLRDGAEIGRSQAIEEAIAEIEKMKGIIYNKDSAQHIRNVEKHILIEKITASLQTLKQRKHE